jgi:two-component system, OmpR family, response regulator MprA
MGRKILVVDDEPDVANAWARALKLSGHQVLVANDTAGAIALSEAHPLDIVILDYLMPSMSGVELLSRIRRDHPLVRSIIISGKLDASVSEGKILSDLRANIEADLYLHKPVENARLISAVADLAKNVADKDWKSVAESRLKALTRRKDIRAAEGVLNQNRTKKR